MSELSTTPLESTTLGPYIIGIGASAGGMAAIHDLFENMPTTTGFSFVVVQHLSPDHKSLMADLLSRYTLMQVFEAEDDMLAQPDCVYVLPSKKIMTVQRGRLRLDDKIKDRREGQHYQMSPTLRKMVIFAQYDVVKDPPFSQVDLVSCRNMLIYVEPTRQKNVLKKFHFALNPHGYLLLGPSENIGILKEHMQEVERKWKLYQCISKARDYERDTFFAPFEAKSLARMYSPPSASSGAKNALNNIGKIFKETTLEMQLSAGIFLDKDLNVKHAIGEFKRYLHFPDSNFNLHILKLVSPELALPLGICLRKALANNEKVIMPHVKLQEGDAEHYVNITVKPWLQPKEYEQPFLFVVLGEGKTKKESAAEVVVSTSVGSAARTEEMESTNEELQSQGEEMVSTSEELQSTNEELQSLNEELYTVSAEHQLKIKELIEQNDDLNNYFKNSDIGQILVDRKLTVRRFSPAATRIVNLIKGDVGRSILDITTNIQQLDLANSIKVVLKSGQPLEKEIALREGRFYSLRISPYWRRDKRVDGAVVNFIDITEARRLTSVLESVLNSSISGITAKKTVYDEYGDIVDFEIISVNLAAEKVFGLSTSDLLGERLLQLFPSMEAQYFELYKQVVLTGTFQSFYFFDIQRERWYSVTNVKMVDGLVTTFTDITEDKKMATLLAQNYTALESTSDDLAAINVQLERSNLDLLQFASVVSHDLKEPLRKIQVFGNMLHERVKEQISADDLLYLTKMTTASQRMQTLIEDVLTYSKLSNGELPHKAVDLRQIVRQITDDLGNYHSRQECRHRSGRTSNRAGGERPDAPAFPEPDRQCPEILRQAPTARCYFHTAYYRRASPNTRYTGPRFCGARQRHRFRGAISRANFWPVPTARRAQL